MKMISKSFEKGPAQIEMEVDLSRMKDPSFPLNWDTNDPPLYGTTGIVPQKNKITNEQIQKIETVTPDHDNSIQGEDEDDLDLLDDEEE